MPIVSIGPVCARRGCQRPPWKDRLCARCWRFGHLFGKDLEMFAYEPLHGYRDDRDAVELPWERLEESGGRGLADLFADPSAPDRSEPGRPAR